MDGRKLKIKMRVRCVSADSCTDADSVAVNDAFSTAVAVEVIKI